MAVSEDLQKQKQNEVTEEALDEGIHEGNKMAKIKLEEKHRHVLLLKKLLEQRLRKRLKAEQEFQPSPQVK